MSGNPLDRAAAALLGRPDADLDPAELHAHQWRCLRDTVAWARERSPYYRRTLAAIDPDSLYGRDDLACLPFTTADDLRRNDPPLLCVSQDEIARVVTLETSGTSGPAKRLFFTAADLEATVAFFQVGMSVFTEPGDRVFILFPGERPASVGALLASAVTRLGGDAVAAGWPLDLPAMAARLRASRPQVVAGVPVAVLALARQTALDGPFCVPRVLLSADHASTALRSALRELWQCEIHEHYGMTEMGLGGGVDCPCHDGYHMREAELLVEIVDPASGLPLPTGQTGEIVVTTLTRRGLPLIRYRTGDLSRLLPGACGCGSPLMRLARIAGRLNTAAMIAGVPLTMADLDEALFALPRLIDYTASFQPGPPPRLSLRIAHLASPSIVEAARAALADLSALTPALAAGLELEVSAAGSALLTGAGKRRIALHNAA